MNLLAGRVNNEGTHFELDGGIALPLNRWLPSVCRA